MVKFGYGIAICLCSLTLAATCFRSQQSTSHDRQNIKVLNQINKESQNVHTVKNDNSKSQNAEQNEVLGKTHETESSYGDYVTLVYGNEKKVIPKPKQVYPDFLDPDVTTFSTDR